MSSFYVNNKELSYEEFLSLNRETFVVENINNIPRSFFKYFPNITNEHNDRNYSIEALENNTVYLQSPDKFDDPYDCTIYVDQNEFVIKQITYYAKMFGIDVKPNWDYGKTLYELAVVLYNKFQSGEQIDEICNSVINSDTAVNQELRFLTIESFLLCIIDELNKNKSSDAWQVALNKAMCAEYDRFNKSLKSFRVSCFAQTPYSLLMWSHYANSHKGFCIEYKTPEYSEKYGKIFHNLHPVIYSNTRIDAISECLEYNNDAISKETLWHLYKYGLLSKSLDWKYQNEWRLIYTLETECDCNWRFFDIKKVYLGSKMEKAERQKIIDICKRKGISYVGVIISNDKYEMTDCQQLCENCMRFKSDNKNDITISGV